MLQPKIGDIIDGFVIRQTLYDGATACLYKADDSFDASRSVVLKIPKDNIFNQPDLFYHFQNEEILSRYLNHPGVVRFLSRKSSRLYLVQEYVEGVDLKTYVQRAGALDHESAVSLCSKIYTALSYLHSRSIIHLDLKPENIMVQFDGEVKIIDFGLAHHLGLPDLIGEDFCGPKGTPYYISPEQLCGRRDSPQSDIYSLGVIFYEMLTGQLPFEKSTKLSRVEMRLKRKPIPPRHFDRSLAPQLQQIVLRMLEPDLAKRYANVDELIADLDNWRELEVTIKGQLVEKPGRLLDFILPADCSAYKKREEAEKPAMAVRTRQLLGCLIDDGVATLVVEELKREAICSGGVITLLIVLEDDIEPLEVTHLNEVTGANFAKKIDGYISYLKKYGLDVSLRVQRGKPAEEIVKMAEKISADLVVLGPPRVEKGLRNLLSFFGGNTISTLIESLDMRLRILKPASSGAGPRLDGINRDSLHDSHDSNLKIYFTDIWVYHLNCLIQAIDTRHQSAISSAKSCPSGRWLADVGHELWPADLTARLLDIHEKLHGSVDEIVRLRKSGLDFRNVYRHESLPLLEDLKKVLEEVMAVQEGSREKEGEVAQ